MAGAKAERERKRLRERGCARCAKQELVFACLWISCSCGQRVCMKGDGSCRYCASGYQVGRARLFRSLFGKEMLQYDTYVPLYMTVIAGSRVGSVWFEYGHDPYCTGLNRTGPDRTGLVCYGTARSEKKMRGGVGGYEYSNFSGGRCIAVRECCTEAKR